MIKVFEPASGCVELLVTGVSSQNLTTSGAIANLIGELRAEMTARKSAFAY
jgi:ABC-type cobalt transport system substrate-binding protein